MKPKVPALQEERKVLQEITLSKSTFDSPTQMPLSRRVAWLRYELPASLNLGKVLPMVLPAMLFLPFMALTLFAGQSIPQILTHPDFLLFVLCGFVFCCAVPMVAVLAASLVFLINPKEFLNLWVFPDLISIREDLFELRWTKATKGETALNDQLITTLAGLFGKKSARRIRIPWHWISSVNMRDYLYMGVLPQKVLEIELSEIPASYHEWNLLEKVSRDGSYYFDPATKKLANKFALGGLRLPLPLFAFSSDVNVLLENIRSKCGTAVIGDVSLIEEDDSNEIESFTCLWLEELNSKGARDVKRQLPIGSTLQNGTYTIASVLGSGGLSVVYLANGVGEGPDTSTSGNQVAIKEILCNFGGTKRSVEKNLKQILNEISMLRKLEHPNIVKYKTSFAEGSRLYIVMDLVEGSNLRQYVQNNPPVSEHQLLDILRQCCSILDYLHSQNPPVLHRDFTPDNLMISDGALKLVDFNISQSAITNSSNTVMGKHCFMAPEQFCGEASVASDLYQLGATIFYLAAVTDPEPLTQCELQTLRPDLSRDLHDVVLKLTHRDPADRFASAKELSDTIERLVNHSLPKREVV